MDRRENRRRGKLVAGPRISNAWPVRLAVASPAPQPPWIMIAVPKASARHRFSSEGAAGFGAVFVDSQSAGRVDALQRPSAPAPPPQSSAARRREGEPAQRSNRAADIDGGGGGWLCAERGHVITANFRGSGRLLVRPIGPPMARAGEAFALVFAGMFAMCMLRLAYLWLRWFLRGRPGGVMGLRDIALREIAPPPLAEDASSEEEEEEAEQPAPAAVAAPRTVETIRQQT